MAGGGGHILVVDDNQLNRKLLARAVKKQGHRVTTAVDGKQALALLQSRQAGPFDVILLDILMPEMDGYQVLERVKADGDLRHIPVIMISALDEMDSVLRCIELGATDYLPKPFNTALLRARINASLAEKRLRDLELEYLEQARHVADGAAAVEAGAFDPTTLEGVASRQDGLGQLARVFQRMAREVHLREQRLRQHLQQLRQDMEEMQRALAEPLSVHLPMDRRQALAEGATLPERGNGAALFADVSGFTPLTAALAQELGLQRGAEELTRLLNGVYGALITEVHRYGGSVISFAGDAITCWFAEEAPGPARFAPGSAQDGAPPAEPERAGLRAAACALAMQGAMAEFASVATPMGSSFSLAIKVAAVTGPVRRFLVGDAQVQKLEVMAGSTLDLLAQAEHQARRGEVVVSADLADLDRKRLAVLEWRSEAENGPRFAVLGPLAAPVLPAPWPDLAADSLSEADCRPWLLPEVYRRVCSGGKQFLAELRPVVAVFVRFLGIDYDGDEGAGDKLDAFVRWVQVVMDRHGGVLLRVTIGDKGSYLLAAFGTPTAHHDDQVRAVSAALALQSIPPELDYIESVQIGLAQGLMRTGTYGSATRRTYELQGDKANLAARLMQAAVDGILCDDAVNRAAQARLVFETLPPIQVKGKEHPIPVYRPTGEKKRQARRQVALLGRTSERVVLRQCLERVQHGSSSIVLVEGEAGIGKSRLVSEAKARAEAMGIPVLSLAAQSAEKSTPYHAWREVLRELCELGPGHESAGKWDRLVGLLQDRPEALKLAPLLAPLLSLGMTDNEVTARLRGQARIDRAREPLVTLFQNHFRGSSKVILIEDAQDLDAPSWMLTLALAQHLPALLLVVASRALPEPLPAGYVRLRQAAHLHVLALAPLSTDEAYLLACEHLGVGSLPPAIVDLVHKAAGNPLVLEDLVYQLRDEAYVTVSGGTCQVTPGANLQDVAVPTTAQGVILSRMDRLSASELLTLKVASVIGPVFSRQMLYDILPVASDRPHLDKHLESLVRLGLILSHAPEPTFTFKDLYIQETAYRSMLYAQRRQLHRLAAEWYERTFAQDLAPYGSILARHWRQADEMSRALDYLEMAGRHAMAKGAHEEAERLFQESLELEAQSAVLRRGYLDDGAPEAARPPAEGPDYAAAKRYALDRLERELAPALSYHNLAHTRDDVLPAALRLAAIAGLTEEDRRLLEVAAVYHDIGFTVQVEGHERASAEIAAQALPGFGFDAEQVAAVQSMILATRFPQSPQTLLEKLLADADLDNLGRADALERSQAMRAELEALGTSFSADEWYRRQLAFVREHNYWTEAARSLRSEGKARTVAALERLLTGSKAGQTEEG
jgi:adenylate cyclase